jgi:hypothetical protein
MIYRNGRMVPDDRPPCPGFINSKKLIKIKSMKEEWLVEEQNRIIFWVMACTAVAYGSLIGLGVL